MSEIDVSLEASSVSVVDDNGKVACEGKVGSEPDDLIAWLTGRKPELTRIGLEAGPLSKWQNFGRRKTDTEATHDATESRSFQSPHAN